MLEKYRNAIFISLISLPAIIICFSSIIALNVLGEGTIVLIFYIISLLICVYILREYENLIFVSVASLLAILTNFPPLVMSGEPGRQQIIASALFLVSLFLYGLYTGYNKEKSFLKFSTIYWGTGYLLLILAFYLKEIFMVPVVFIFIGPTYGLSYFMHMPFTIKFVTINIASIYGISIGTYYTGWICRQMRM